MWSFYGEILTLQQGRRHSLPDIIVENIEIEREINGAQWKTDLSEGRTQGWTLYGESLDITIAESGDKITRINANKGVFTRANNDIEMTSADAVMTEKDNVYNLKAGRVEFEAVKELWRFSKGVMITDGKTTVEGKEGTYDTKKRRMHSIRRGSSNLERMNKIFLGDQ